MAFMGQTINILEYFIKLTLFQTWIYFTNIKLKYLFSKKPRNTFIMMSPGV